MVSMLSGIDRWVCTKSPLIEQLLLLKHMVGV